MNSRRRPEAQDGGAHGRSSLAVAALAGVGAGVLGWWTLVTFFSPRLKYRLPAPVPTDSDAFTRVIESSCPARRSAGNRITLLPGGDVFYSAMLETIGTAQRSITLETYVLKPGRVADALVDALVERRRAGVAVSLVLDTAGSLGIRGAHVDRLRAAGARVEFYDPWTWSLVDRLNNRTHRELLIIDGLTAFVGGPGFADYWRYPIGDEPPWRDTSVRLDGPVVTDLQGVFAENWLESSGEVLAGDAYFPKLEAAGGTPVLVIKSSPADRSTPAHLLFYALIACARQSIHVSTPYFVPDQTMREALAAAARRGVDVRLLVPGGHADQKTLHVNSRRWFGELLAGGVRIFEYQPAMLHQKLLIVDGLWGVMGSTNMDNRSFELNDEVNVAFPDAAVARDLEQIYARDLSAAHEVTLEEWRRRSSAEKIYGRLAWVLDRQQ